TEKNRGELVIALVPHIVRAPEYTELNLRSISAGNDQNVKLNYSPRPEPLSVPATAAPAQPVKPNGQAPAPDAAKTAETLLLFNPGTATTQLNGAVTLQLVLENVRDLSTAPIHLKFDSKVLRLTSIQPGALLTGDGQKINFSENTQNDTGEAVITLNRL